MCQNNYVPKKTKIGFKYKNKLIRASDRVRQKMGNSAAFSSEIMQQEMSIMWQIMRFF